MTKRQILYAVLGFMATMIFVMVAAVAVLLLTKPNAKIIWTDPAKKEAQKTVRKASKWEGKEKIAIGKVKAVQVDAPPDPEDDKKGRKKNEEVPKTSLGQLASSGWFDNTFKTGKLDAVGWQARWAKEAWYFVSYNRRDGLINVGPTWLVNVKDGRILPKNTMARAGMKPGLANAKKHFEHERQVIGSIANHSFDSGVTLGGIMLIHFSGITRSEGDHIVGWTILHDYGDSYRAYFQWIENGEPTYADFEFDYKKKALRSRNLQAANLMNLGGDFERTERVSIMPASYNPAEPVPAKRWTGKSYKACKAKANAARCRALAKILSDQALINSVEWLLTTRAGDAAKFSACKTDRRCKWTPRVKKAGVFEVEYSYELDSDQGEKGGKATWLIDVRKNKIMPQDELAEMAFLAVNPRQL